MKNKKIRFDIFIFIIFISLLSVGFAAWSIGFNNESENNGSFDAYDIINYSEYIDLTTNESYYNTAGKNKNVLKYYDTGFLDITSTTVQSDAVIRCYFSLIPSQMGISNSTFNINFLLSEADNLSLLNGCTITSRVIQQTSATGFDEVNSGSTNSISYNNISSNYSVRLYMYVEYIISGMNFTTFKNNVNNVKFNLGINVEDGNSTGWHISYQEELLPQKDNLAYLANNLNGKEKNTTGSAVNVYKDNNNVLWDFLGVTESVLTNSYSLSYYDESTSTYSSTLPKKAGTYEFKIQYSGSSTEYKTFSFKINGTKVYAGSKNEEYHVINLAYIDASTKTWGSDFEGYIKDKLSFVLETGIAASITSNDFKIARMTDLSFTYINGSSYTVSLPSEFASTYNTVVGSTYYITLELANDDFELSNKIILKYKTAFCDSNYYTIEDAINKEKEVTLAGFTSNTEYVTTSFSKYVKYNNVTDENNQLLYKNSCYNVKKSLIVPYTDCGGIANDNTGGYDGFDDSKKNPGYSASKVITCSCLFIPDNIVLKVETNIYVTAYIDTSSGSSNEFLVQQHGVIMNKGIINFESGVLYAYGFVKGVFNENNGTGIINMKSGTSVYEAMSMYDWGGGSNANSLNNDKVFVINTWMVNNISCFTRYYKGSSLSCTTGVYIPTMTIGYVQTTVEIIHSEYDTNSKCLFMPTNSSTPSDYILKYGKASKTESYNPNGSIIIGNQDLNQKTHIELNGKYVDSNFSVSFSVLVVTVNMTASEVTIPISNFDFTFAENSSVTFNYLKLALMCGTSATIEKNASLYLKGGSFVAADRLNGSNPVLCPGFKSYCKNLVDAKIINNGNIISTSSYIGGNLKSNDVGAVISGSAAIPTIKLKSSGSNYTTTTNYNAFGNVLDASQNIVESDLLQNYYESNLLGSDYYWKYINDINIYNHTIKFYDDTTNIFTLEIPSTEETYIFSGSEYSYNKNYYDFNGWVTTNGGSISAIGSTILSDGTLNVYASWTPVIYSINYTSTFGTSIIDLSDSNLSNTSSLINTFQFDGTNFKYGSNYETLSSSLPLAQLEYTYNNKVCVFEGWDIYIEILGNVYSKTVNTSLSASAFEQLVSKADEYGIDLGDYDIPLVCRFYDYSTLTITYSDGNSYTPSIVSQSGTGNFVLITPELLNYSNTIVTDNLYFVGWENTTLGLFVGFNENINISILNGNEYYINNISLGVDVYNITLTAKWVSKPNILTVNYLKESELGDSNIEYYYYMPNQSFVTIDVTNIGDSVFGGWYLDSLCTNAFDTSSTISNSMTIYAKWVEPVTITFNPNGGTGTMSNQSVAPGFTTNLNNNTFTRTGYTFAGWNTSANGSGTSYSNQDSITVSNDTILYAQWSVISYKVTIKTSNSSTAVTVSGVTINSGGLIAYDSIVKVVLSYSQSNNQTFTIKQGNTNVTRYSNEACTTSTTSTAAGTYYFKMPAGDVTINSSSEAGSCLLPNTLVTMADGTLKEIQYIVSGDMIMVFNHETGMLDISPVTFNEYEDIQWFNVIHLIFDNGSDIGVISEHGFFDLNTMRYEYIDETNYHDFIGHRFYCQDGQSTTLIDAFINEEYTMCYSLPSYYHLNLFTNNILSMPGGIAGLFNIFEYADNLQYDQDLMQEDIEKYGLFTVEEFEPYGVTEEMFNAYAGQYLKVALGKGILTEEYLMYLINRYGKYTE